MVPSFQKLKPPQDSRWIKRIASTLEALATELATQRANEKDLQRIHAAFEDLRRHTLKIDRSKLATYDARFHITIAEATHNFAIIHVMNGMHGLVRETMRSSRQLPNYEHDVELKLLSQHEEIFDRIMSRDARGARKAAESHLNYVMRLHRDHAMRDSATQ